MAELLLELYSEEVPPQLQIAARSQIKHFIENTFKEENVKYKELRVFSSPTRLTLFINDLAMDKDTSASNKATLTSRNAVEISPSDKDPRFVSLSKTPESLSESFSNIFYFLLASLVSVSLSTFL